MNLEILMLILALLGVLGTWVGIYLAYTGLRKDTKKIIRSINKLNVQSGNGNISFQ